MGVSFAHTNIVAKDWRKLADFYIKVFDCEPVYPERNLKGEWVEKLTGIKDAHIKGIHLRLPGYADGPTLEIFSYNKLDLNSKPFAINMAGFAHIAFLVDDVPKYLDRITKNGGSSLGELIERNIDGVGILNAVYIRDPEGNIVEILNWK